MVNINLEHYVAQSEHYINKAKEQIYDPLTRPLSRLVDKAEKNLWSSVNRDTIITYAGFWGGVGIERIIYLTFDPGIPTDIARLIPLAAVAYPILKGSIGNIKRYLSPKKAFRVDPEHKFYDNNRMTTAGVSLHSVGEYLQLVAMIVGGNDFSLGSKGLDQLLLDPHTLPYTIFNVAGFYLIVKGFIISNLYLGAEVTINSIKNLVSK